MKLIAKLGIIYAMPASAQLRWTVWVSVATAVYYCIQTRHEEGEVGISETAAAAAGTLGLL